MREEDLTPELEAKIVASIMENKPYILAIEDEINNLGKGTGQPGYGTVEVRLEVRNGIVTKMQFWSGSTWLKDKL